MHHPQANTGWAAVVAVILAIFCGAIIGGALVEAKSRSGEIGRACAPLFTGEGMLK